MGFAVFVGEYIIWHYSKAFGDILELSRNFLWFGYHFFSFSLLLKTLFSPFYRIQEAYKGGLKLELLMESIVANTVSRIVGFIFRIFVIFSGIIFEVSVLVLSFMALMLWFFFPAVVAWLFVAGLASLF